MEKKLKLTTKKYKGDTSVISLRLPVELIERLDYVSNKTGRARTDVAIKCLEFALDNIIIESDEEEENG